MIYGIIVLSSEGFRNSSEGVQDVSRNVWVREHFIWAKGEIPQGFWKVQKEFLWSPGPDARVPGVWGRRRELWRLALESGKDSCLSGETDFVEASTPSFDPKAQHINRGVGLAPKTHQETPSRVGYPVPSSLSSVIVFVVLRRSPAEIVLHQHRHHVSCYRNSSTTFPSC